MTHDTDPYDAPASGMSDVPTYAVTLLPQDLRFAARGDESLLKAGLRAMAPMPSSCRNGTCRTCLCRLESGSVAYEIEWPGVTREEQAEGLVLPCVARPLSDVALCYDQRSPALRNLETL